MIGVVDSFVVHVVDIRAGVGESPRNVAVESDHHTRNGSESDTGCIELSRNDDVHLIPDRWQRQLEMRVSGEYRLTSRRFGWTYRPVVASNCIDSINTLEQAERRK